MDPTDIDPEVMAMFMGIAEEMAEEERRRYDLRGETTERFNDFDGDQPQDNPSRASGAGKQKRPFERYVDDICFGRKKLGDPPDIGYNYRRNIPFPRSDHHRKPIRIKNVAIFRAHLVSDKFLSFIGDVLERYPEHRIKGIIFNTRKYPRKKDHTIFAIYMRRSGMIVFNLNRHFENAARVALDVNTSYSIRALIWYSMIGALLHELHHSITQTAEEDPTGEARQQVEDEADRWSNSEIGNLARMMEMEPPPIEEEPYFSACFNRLMQRQEDQERQEWVDHQKLLLDANVMYWDPETCIAYPTMKEFLGVVPDDRKEQAHPPEQEDYADTKNQEMADYWKEDERKESAIQEAINMGYRLKIDYEDRHGHTSRNQTIHPRQILYRNGYLFAEAFCEQRQANQHFRISQIQNIAFVT